MFFKKESMKLVLTITMTNHVNRYQHIAHLPISQVLIPFTEWD
jgi:hypothetical protein